MLFKRRATFKKFMIILSIIFLCNFYNTIHLIFSTKLVFNKEDLVADLENPDKLSLVVLPYTELPPRRGGSVLPVDVMERCQLSFHCVVYDDSYRKFPRAAINKFSAIIAWGPGHKHFLSLYNEVGGVTARPWEQFWISTGQESAINSNNGNHMEGISHLFNWTAGSGRKLTFQVGDFSIQKRKQKKSLEEIEKELRKRLSRKRYFVCWAMNNCITTFTNRVQLAKDLVKYLPEKLKLFGKSGSDCMSGMDAYVDYYGRIPGEFTDAIRQQIDNCMFYLSFENSNCTDYVTEKFSNPLISYAIPIVNGFKQSYEKRLPGSYIYYKDFPSAKELSNYLQYLRLNWTAFMEYHKWRQFYTVRDLKEAQDRLYCDICKRLKEEKDSGYQNSYSINDVRKTYKKMQTCVID